MRLPQKDVVATALVAGAGLVYALWASGSAPPGMSGIRVSGTVVLALGFAASASAVVPGFEQLLHGNKIYVALTSLVGLVALIGGVQMLVAASDAGFAIVIGAILLLWLIATVHHSLLATHQAPTARGGSRPMRMHGPRTAH